MKCAMRLLLAVIAIPTIMGVGPIADAVDGNLQPVIDFSAFHAASKPNVVVHAISVQRMMRVKLTKERFDPYVDTNGADYVLTILNPERAKRAAQLMERLELERCPHEAPSVGVRYRIRFLDGETILRTLYVSPFGEIVDDEQVLRPTKEGAWIRELWGQLERDLVK